MKFTLRPGVGDYSPVSLALADSPTGPWTRWPKNPVLREGLKGAWDDGGFSEAEVFYADGGFHMFYGGAKIHPQRICTRESIGYAFSSDGYRPASFRPATRYSHWPRSKRATRCFSSAVLAVSRASAMSREHRSIRSLVPSDPQASSLVWC